MKKPLLFLVCIITCTQAMENRLTLENRNAIQAEHDWCHFLTDLSMTARTEGVKNTQFFGGTKVQMSNVLLEENPVSLPFTVYMCNHQLDQGNCTFTSKDRHVLKYHRKRKHTAGPKYCSFPFCRSIFTLTSQLQSHAKLHSSGLVRYYSRMHTVFLMHGDK
ncbi:MAG: hypothetical protein WC707_00885 [Candidatus Babeliaceae bacterium]|jgi:hypothetical protein